jgi:hypothetical protein
MKYLLTLLIAIFLSGCLYIAEEPPDSSMHYEEEIGYVPCMYDPLPFDYPMRYCDTYSDAECCFWEDRGDSWQCTYEWCFHWDECRWEYIDSDCTW